MAPSPFFSGRIPQELHDRIAKHIEETGESKTQILVNALSAYMNYPVQPAALSTSQANSWVDEKFNLLEQRIASLDAVIAEVAELKHQVATIVANTDNKPDNVTDNRMIDKGQLSLLENNGIADNVIDNIADNIISEQEASAAEETGVTLPEVLYDQFTDIRELTLEEILALPELQNQDLKKLEKRLLNAKYQNRLPISAGQLTVDDTGRKRGRKPLWKVWQN